MAGLRIEVRDQGPYIVHGIDPERGLRRREVVTYDDGHATGWRDVEVLDLDGHVEPDGTVHLCRCGHSKHKPFCDSSHTHAKWDGTEAAPVKRYDALAKVRVDNALEMGDAPALCSHTGFCTRARGDVWHLLHEDLDEQERAQLISMIEHCPSGRLTHRQPAEPTWDEPELDSELVCVVDGQYFVTGGVDLQRADDQPFENRNRVSLCRCGESGTKPLCDGSHNDVDFSGEMEKVGVTAEVPDEE